jgi:hypothetical protein
LFGLSKFGNVGVKMSNIFEEQQKKFAADEEEKDF